MKTFAKLTVLAVIPFLLSGCMSGMYYKENTDTQLAQIQQGDLDGAAKTESSSDVLGSMQTGMLKRMGQNYTDSNTDFASAQASIQTWTDSWKNTTSGQLSADATSLLLNDSFSDYQPTGFEKSYLAMFYALNQVDLDSLDNARVEITQMYEIEEAIANYNQALYNSVREESAQQTNASQQNNQIYKAIQQKYDFPDINAPAVLALRNGYQNAFAHYLAGFVFEALNEPSLARPGYVLAGQLNPTNPLIQQSIDNIDKGVQTTAGSTDLLIVEAVGHAPQIQSEQMTLPVSIGKDKQGNRCAEPVTLFYPKLIYDTQDKTVHTYKLDGNLQTPVSMTSTDLMAARTIHDEMPHLILRNLVAAARDVTIAREACVQGSKDGKGSQGAAIGIGGIALGAFLDRADERAWVLLPKTININRMQLKYGQHTLSISIHGKIHTLNFNLNQPYQILAFRVIGDQVFFEPQQSMGAK